MLGKTGHSMFMQASKPWGEWTDIERNCKDFAVTSTYADGSPVGAR
jgi:hypothetical protein